LAGIHRGAGLQHSKTKVLRLVLRNYAPLIKGLGPVATVATPATALTGVHTGRAGAYTRAHMTKCGVVGVATVVYVYKSLIYKDIFCNTIRNGCNIGVLQALIRLPGSAPDATRRIKYARIFKGLGS
jgi:hypothetical protein